jgi:hypothetical protein
LKQRTLQGSRSVILQLAALQQACIQAACTPPVELQKQRDINMNDGINNMGLARETACILQT